MAEFDDIHRSMDDHVGYRVLVTVLLVIALVGIVIAAIRLTTGTGRTIVGIGLVLWTVLGLLWLWYNLQARPILRAERILATLASSFRLAPTTPGKSGTRSIREVLHRARTKRFIEGSWEGSFVAVGLDPPTGNQEFSSRSSKGYTLVFLTASRPLAKMAQLEIWKRTPVIANRVLAFLGQSPVLKRVSEDFGAYGEDGEIARLFTPSVLALVRAFPRKMDGPTVEGNEIRMEWEDLEKDPAVIESAFRLLKTVAEAAPVSAPSAAQPADLPRPK
jgi:hypothetical protein